MNVRFFPNCYYGMYSIENPVCTFGSHGPYSEWHSKRFKRVPKEHLAGARFPAKASSASRGSQRTSSPERTFHINTCIFSKVSYVSFLSLMGFLPWLIPMVSSSSRAMAAKVAHSRRCRPEVRSEQLVCSLLRRNNQTGIDRAHNLLSRACAVYILYYTRLL